MRTKVRLVKGSHIVVAALYFPVWDRVSLENQGKTTVVVAHGIVIRVILLSVLDGYNAADWPRLGRIPNVSISELVADGRAWRAARIGYVPDEVRKVNEAEEVRTRDR